MEETHDIAEVLEAAFKLGPVTIVVNTTIAGVVVPPAYRGFVNLKLNFSPRFEPRDLVMGEESISQTLSFNGEPFHVVIPWEAVLAFRDAADGSILIMERMPPEIRNRFVQAVFTTIEKPVVEKKPTLRVLH